MNHGARTKARREATGGPARRSVVKTSGSSGDHRRLDLRDHRSGTRCDDSDIRPGTCISFTKNPQSEAVQVASPADNHPMKQEPMVRGERRTFALFLPKAVGWAAVSTSRYTAVRFAGTGAHHTANQKPTPRPPARALPPNTHLHGRCSAKPSWAKRMSPPPTMHQ